MIDKSIIHLLVEEIHKSVVSPKLTVLKESIVGLKTVIKKELEAGSDPNDVCNYVCDTLQNIANAIKIVE